MNYMKYFNLKYTLLVLLGVLIGTSCKDDIDVTSDNDYTNIEGTYGYVRSITGARSLAEINIFEGSTGTGRIYYELTKAATSDVNVQFEVNAEDLEAFNAANGTSYELYPGTISFEKEGKATITSGSKATSAISMVVNGNGAIGSTYAVPVSVKFDENSPYKESKGGYYIYLIKQLPTKPVADKGTGIINVGYIEVNDESLLNMGEYTMKNSGKPFFDVVHIFAANLNFDSKTNRVHLNCNDNVAFVLKNAEKTIRPLQNKGIKVCLSLLGNWDQSGMASLSAEAAADFAQELKAYVDLYGLDGIDFDDEWSAYNEGDPNPGFAPVSADAYARLVYETQKAMPNKFISVYEVGNYLPTGTVEGIDVTTLYDYSYNPYYGSWKETYMNTPNDRYGPYPVDLSVDLPNISRVQQVKDGGYGVMVFYNYKKDRALDYLDGFLASGRILFNDDIVWTGNTFGKQDFASKKTKPAYEDYLGTFDLTPDRGLFWYTDGPYWQWKDDVKFTLRIEENVKGESYKVYGWGLSGDEIPFIMNYNSFNGKVSINLPQTVKDANGTEWKYVARTSYYPDGGSIYKDNATPAFDGSINPSGAFKINSTISEVLTMSPVLLDATGNITDINGGILQDVAYAPYTLAKQ